MAVVNIRPVRMAVLKRFMQMFVGMPASHWIIVMFVIMMPIIMRVKVIMLPGLMNVGV